MNNPSQVSLEDQIVMFLRKSESAGLDTAQLNLSIVILKPHKDGQHPYFNVVLQVTDTREYVFVGPYGLTIKNALEMALQELDLLNVTE